MACLESHLRGGHELPVHLLREKLQQCRPSAKNAGVVLFQNEQSNFI